MKFKILQWLAITLMIQAGVIYWMTAQIEYDKAPYLGYLSMLNLLGALIAIFGIYHKQTWGWISGALISTGTIFGFIWARTQGLPGLKIEPWLYPFGIITASADGMFLLLCLLRPWKISATDNAPTPIWFSFLLPSATLVLVASATFSTYQWDVYAKQVGYHEHVGSLDFVCKTAPTSFDELERKYGIRITLVAVTAMDSIVDVRLQVIDPDKANQLLVNQAALLVDQKALVLAPHLHRHSKLKAGRPVVMFFPTQNHTVKSGSEVSLVFGRVRVVAVTVK